MRCFSCSSGNEYTILTVDYVSKGMEVVPTRTIGARVIVDFIRENIFSRYSKSSLVTKVLLDNRSFDTLLKK